MLASWKNNTPSFTAPPSLGHLSVCAPASVRTHCPCLCAHSPLQVETKICCPLAPMQVKDAKSCIGL